MFCVAFDSAGEKLYSGGNDEQVIVHDLATRQPVDYFLHEEPVYGVSVNPENSNIFLTACSDGRVLQYDLRDSGRNPSMLTGCSHAFHAVTHNPVEPRLVATANQKQGAGLWDVRVPGRAVLQYGSAQPGSSTAMSVAWNQAGERLLGLRRRLPPVLYSLDSPAAVCQFDHAGYYNSCTMKSCCFAGPNDEYVVSGSDDFRIYCWAVPGPGQRWVDRAHRVLRGNRSIVNQVRYNPSRAVLASSGVEKVVRLWSVLPLPDRPGESQASQSDRRVYSHEEYIGLVLRSGSVVNQEAAGETTEENPRMMAFFDSLVQREIEGWDSSSEDQSGGDGGLRSDLSSSDSDSSSSSEPNTSGRLAGVLSSSPGREEVFSGGSPAPAASHSQVRCCAVL